MTMRKNTRKFKVKVVASRGPRKHKLMRKHTPDIRAAPKRQEHHWFKKQKGLTYWHDRPGLMPEKKDKPPLLVIEQMAEHVR